jgi:hypothetical protein
MALMQQAQERNAPPAGAGAAPPGAPDTPGESGGGSFKRPDISQFTPPAMQDIVQRIAAAGMKIMYSPDMRQELMKEVQRDVPVPQKLAEAVVGLMLTLDQKAQGGIPAQAIFPAAMELLGEAAEVLSAAGQQVTQQDYNDAARMMFVLIARKMGAKDDQIMGAAQQIAGGGAPAAGPPAGPPDAAEPAGDDTGGAEPNPDEQEVSA